MPFIVLATITMRYGDPIVSVPYHQSLLQRIAIAIMYLVLALLLLWCARVCYRVSTSEEN